MFKLYGLKASEEIHFSPFVWRAILCLEHKGLAFEYIGLTFVEIQEKIPKLSKGDWDKVPVLELEDGTYIYDSPNIANYLEEHYPDNKLFPHGRNFSTFIEGYSPIYFTLIFRSVFMDIYISLDDKNKEYFKASREGKFKVKLEEISGKPEDQEELIKALNPFATVLSSSKFLEGPNPTYSDYLLFGSLQLVKQLNDSIYNKIVSSFEGEVLGKWFDSICQLYNGQAKKLIK